MPPGAEGQGRRPRLSGPLGLGVSSAKVGDFDLPTAPLPSYDFGVMKYFERSALAWVVALVTWIVPVASVAATPPPAAAPAVTPAPGYRLHPGDQLAVTVYGEAQLSQNTTVLPDGTITYPLIGKLDVGGDTIDTATAKVTRALREYVRDPDVSIAITQLGNYDVLVLGDVKTPGKYPLPPTARVTDAIAAAGGLGDINGEYPNARVSINNGPPVTISLQSLLRDGDVASNLPLGPESVVYVPGPTPLAVQVIGNVDKPGTVEVHVGDRLSMAIAVAGTTTNSQADLAHIRVTSVAADGSTQEHEYNLYRALKGGDLTSDPVLAKNDVIYVPQAHQQNAMSAFAQGIFLLLSRLYFPI
jgi:polysaccharide biosynthesis/export protein